MAKTLTEFVDWMQVVVTGKNPPTWTNEQKLACVEREIALRRRVYPTRVANKRMTQQLADRQISMMEEIAEDYRRKVESERLL